MRSKINFGMVQKGARQVLQHGWKTILLVFVGVVLTIWKLMSYLQGENYIDLLWAASFGFITAQGIYESLTENGRQRQKQRQKEEGIFITQPFYKCIRNLFWSGIFLMLLAGIITTRFFTCISEQVLIGIGLYFMGCVLALLMAVLLCLYRRKLRIKLQVPMEGDEHAGT